MPSKLYIKRLELSGFKSFVNKTTFNFDPGLTAVVGPNGCGKSNIIDAVRWVLGEQSSRALRGGRMEEMIFHGSERMKPVGMAEVTLTFDNEQSLIPRYGSEFSLTRRLYRSGESEYLINKEQVRLKDVTDVILDTGVSTGAYIVMEQGKIDYILTSRPSERVALFEEASGVMRYQLQKEEAERKLEATQQNLMRVGDIVGELRRQVDSLERQARQAEQYQQMRKSASDLKARQRAVEMVQGRKGMEEAEAKVLDTRGRLDQVRAALGERQGKLKESRQEQDEKERQVRTMEREMAERREAQGVFGAQLEQLKLEMRQLAVLKQEREGRLADAKAAHERFRSRAGKALAEEQADGEGLSQAQEELARLAGEVGDAEKSLSELREGLASRRRSLGSQAERLHRGVQPAVGAAEADSGPLEELRQAIPGVEWPLARIFRTEEPYAQAVQAALGPLADAALVETWEQAHALLSAWRDKHEAPLTLIVQEALGEPEPRGELPAGAIGWADELVAVPPRHAALARALLGNVAVMPGEPVSPVAGNRAYTSGLRLAAPGVLWWPGRLVRTGKGVDADLALLLSSAVQELGEMESRIVDVEAGLIEARRKESLANVEVARFEQRLHGRRGERANFEQSAEESAGLAARLQQELEGIAADLSRQEQELKRRDEDSAREKRAMEKLSAEIFIVQEGMTRQREEMQAVEKDIDECRAQADELQRELTDQEAKFYEARAQFDLVRHDFEAEFGSDAGKLEELAAQPLSADEASQLDRLSGKLAAIGEGINLLALDEYNELSTRYKEYVQQIEDLRKSREKLQRAIYRLDRESEKRFTRTFETIRENFHAQFRRLFGGGDADLKLLENEEGERGIEIDARPPGKRAQAIGLLSGGERALVSTSLLFALYMTKPSPFCFLDELDAPLDDANTDRFIKILKEFNQQTQFVMITHNKQTMELCDNLYGITMEEPGISKIVSIHLSKPVPVPTG